MQWFDRWRPAHWPADTGLSVVLWLLAVALGVSAGIGTEGGVVVAAGAIVAVAGVMLLFLRPRWVFFLFLLTILVLEEFPSVQGETLERSTRTAFYAKSLGIGGLYAPDVWMLALLGMFVFIKLATHQRFALYMDRIGWALLLIAFTATLSIVLSFVDGNPFEGGVIQETTGVGFAINEQALQFIALFHFKLFFLLFLSYVLTLLIIDTPQRLNGLLPVFLAAACVCCLVGLARLAANPALVVQGLPLFYDSPSSWFFGLFAMYTVAAWAYGLHGRRTRALLTVVSFVLMFFVLVSFRRTMWAAILFAGIPLMIWLPTRAKGRLLLIGGVTMGVLLVVALLTPLRDILLAPVLGRVEQTNVADASTLYRLAVAVYMADAFTDIPWFGYGAKPLWNEIAALGFFRTNVENVHSLYWWWLLRTGLVGLLVGALAVGMIFRSTWRAAHVTYSAQWRVLGMMVLLALLMFMFSGLFNPVYAQVRYVVLVGVALAITSRILEFSASGASGARPELT
ncbi:O-antigen ligase-related [Comamonadaceae bacterium]